MYYLLWRVIRPFYRLIPTPVQHAIKHTLFILLVHVLPTKPHMLPSTDFGITTVVSHEYVPHLLYCLHSFFSVYKPVFVYIIDDGSLTDSDCELFSKHLHCIIERKASRDRKMKIFLKRYPHISRYRFLSYANHGKYKLDALFLCPFTRYLFLDSDTLFFQSPKEIISWITKRQPTILITDFIKEFKQEGTRYGWIHPSFRLLLFKYLHIRGDSFFISSCIGIPHARCLRLSKIETLMRLFYDINLTNNEHVDEFLLSVALRENSIQVLNPHTYINNMNSATEDMILKHPGVKFAHFPGLPKHSFITRAIRLAIQRTDRSRRRN